MNSLMKWGLLICALCIVIDRFIWEIPSLIAMPAYTAGIVLILAGMIRKRKAAG